MADPKKDEKKEVLGAAVLPAKKTMTYVGAGEDSPRKIHFMGRQEFVRGKAVEVTDPKVLGKLLGVDGKVVHPCFVEGEVKMEALHESDEAAQKKAEEQRKQDAKTNAAFQKKHNRE